MDSQFIIEDIRHKEDFRDKSFSGFKKTEIIKTLSKCIETGKLENACHWTTECILSGYTLDLMDKLIVLSSKLVHINNPRLPSYLWRRYQTLYRSINHIDLKKQKHQLIHIRNSQVIRNGMFDIVSRITLSSKSKRYDNYPKINEKVDFQFESIKRRLHAQANFCPDMLFQFTDPEELRVVINELMFHFKNINVGYESASYWVSWIFQWEKKQKKLKLPYEIDERDIRDIKQSHKKDVVWLIWSAILVESNTREEPTQKQINALYRLFKYDYSTPKRNLRIPLLYHAIGYITHSIPFHIPLLLDPKPYIQCQCKVNAMFQTKKQNEVRGILKPPPTKKKKKEKLTIEQEKANDKLSILTSIDVFLR